MERPNMPIAQRKHMISALLLIIAAFSALQVFGTLTGFVQARTVSVVQASATPTVVIKAVYAGDSAGVATSTFTTGQTVWIWVVTQNIGASFQGVVLIQVHDPNGAPVQVQIQIAQFNAGQTVTDGVGFTLPAHSIIGVYTANALVSDKLISQGGVILASAETQFALLG